MPRVSKKSKPKEIPKLSEKKAEKKTSIIVDAEPKYYFLVIDGSELKNMMELTDALQRMSDDVFYHHVGNGFNHFADWIRDIFGEKEVADNIRDSHNKMEMQVVLLRYFLKKLI